MRVGISVMCQNLAHPSGLLSYYLQLGKYLPERDPGTQYIILAGRKDAEYYRKRCPGVEVVGVGWGNGNRYLRIFTENFLLGRAARKHNLDILFHAGSGIAPLFFTRKTCLVLGIFAMHHLAVGQLSFIQKFYRSLLFRMGLQKADLCVVNSDYVTQLLQANYRKIKGPVEVVHHGVDHVLFHDGPASETQSAALRQQGVAEPYALFVR